MKDKTRSRLLWTLAAAEMLIVGTVMPYLVPVQKFMAAKLGDNLGRLPELALLSLAAIIAGLTLKKAGPARLRVGLRLAGLAAVLLASFKYLTQFPIERFHYLEYTALSTLIYFAWADRGNKKRLFVKTLLLACAVALAEEGTQALIPSRSCNIEDVRSNLLGVCYGLVLAKTVIEAAFQPKPQAAPQAADTDK